MSLLGRLRCWLTRKHDWRWQDAYDAHGIVNHDAQVYWCPRCTKIKDVQFND